MSNYRRPKLIGPPVFFTVALADRESDALVRHVDLLREALRVTRAERPFEILAGVVLPGQLHCIWELPEGDGDYPTRWRLIKSRVSRALPQGPRRASHVLRNERGFWQRRYWEHHIRGEQDMAAHLRYCWFSPVRAGLVARPEDWPYSSIHRSIAKGEYVPESAGHRQEFP